MIVGYDVTRFPGVGESGLRSARSPDSKVGFDAPTSGVLLATSVRGCQCADPVRQILTNGQCQPDELAAKLRRYKLKGTEPRRASQGLKDWHLEHLPLNCSQRFATVCANNRTRPLECEDDPLKRAIGRLRRRL